MIGAPYACLYRITLISSPFTSHNPERRSLCLPIHLGIFPVNSHIPHPRPLDLHRGPQQLPLLVRSQWLYPSPYEVDPQLHQPFHICQYTPDSFPSSDIIGRIVHGLKFARVERIRDVEVPAELHAPYGVESLRQYRVRQAHHALQVKHRKGSAPVQDRYRFGVDATAHRHQRQQIPPVSVSVSRHVVARPVVEVASGDRDAPAAVGPRPRVLRVPAADVAEAVPEAHNVREARGEGVPVDEAADLEGEEVEERGLELRGGRGCCWCCCFCCCCVFCFCFWGGAMVGWRREGAGSDRGQGSGLGFRVGCGAAFLRHRRPGLVGDEAEEAEEVGSRPAQEIQEVLECLV